MTGIELIAAERQRQITEEGFDADHDAQHTEGHLAAGAACYAMCAADQVFAFDCYGESVNDVRCTMQDPPQQWKWSAKWWKPKGVLANLVRAGALIAAEIDRLQREESQS